MAHGPGGEKRARVPTEADLQRIAARLNDLGARYVEDQAVLELAPDELEKYAVVRVADEIVVDLLSSACGVTYDDLRDEIEWAELGGIDVPYASPAALLRTKQTVRDKDVLDRLFLEKLLAEE
jgi:cytochrome P450